MTTYSRVTPTGWVQGDDGSTLSRVTPTGWEQITVTAGASVFIPIVGRGPGMALAGNGGGLASNANAGVGS